MRSGKIEITEGIELTNQEWIRTFGEKETYKYLRLLEVKSIKQVEMKEFFKKRVFMTNEKTSRNQALQPESHQRDVYLGCPPHPCNIRRTVHEMYKGTTRRKGPEDKKR